MSTIGAQAASQAEALTSLRILVAMAQADGLLQAQERAALDAAFAGVTLPAGITLDSLLEERHEFAALLAQVRSAPIRESLYQSACALARADGALHATEERLLSQMQTAFEIAPERQSLATRLFEETKDTLLLSNIVAIADPRQRAAAIREDVTKYSVISAVLGAFPVPGVAIAADLAVVALQVKLLRDIGQYYGFELEQDAAKTVLTGLGLGTGARIAVSNIAKLVPVWGSAFGATAAFATTWALGRIAVKYFDGGMPADLGPLRQELADARGEGEQAFEQQKSAIAEKAEMHRGSLERLAADLAAGRITQAEYEARITQLG